MANLMLLAAAAEHGESAELLAFGFVTPGMWVALSMTVLILVALKLGVAGKLTSGLDSSIAEIRKQLDEAKALRADAEALRKEYADKIANAEKDALAMLEHARTEADAIVAKAETDAKAMVARREKMASDKITAAERSAVAEIQAKAASTAAAAAARLIAGGHGATADQALVDEAISAI